MMIAFTEINSVDNDDVNLCVSGSSFGLATVTSVTSLPIVVQDADEKCNGWRERKTEGCDNDAEPFP